MYVGINNGYPFSIGRVTSFAGGREHVPCTPGREEYEGSMVALRPREFASRKKATELRSWSSSFAADATKIKVA